jgi:hypothetical protein
MSMFDTCKGQASVVGRSGNIVWQGVMDILPNAITAALKALVHRTCEIRTGNRVDATLAGGPTRRIAVAIIKEPARYDDADGLYEYLKAYRRCFTP